MTDHPSLITRIVIGKTIGFAVGLLGFTLLPVLVPDVSWQLRWGILLWYTTVGAIIGVFGVFTYHPVLNLPMPWWIRAPVIGGWMNFVLCFFAWDPLIQVLEHLFTPGSILASPFMLVIEGCLVGLLIGFFATRFGGEGAKTLSV